jgi:4'-phosphopantetheinyl transferase
LEAACASWLDQDERDRADRFRVPTSRNQHVVGRGMARKLLGGEEVAPQSIRFAIEPHGKPYVVHPDSAKQPFNVAHTDGLVLCGIGSSEHTMIGVDVERVGRRTDPGLADRFFSPPEIDYLNRLPAGEARRTAFLRIWTLKESFIKAIGTGLQTPLADFAFDDIESDSPTIQMLDAKLHSELSWRFFSLQPCPGFVAAIAVALDVADAPVSVELRRFDASVE